MYHRHDALWTIDARLQVDLRLSERETRQRFPTFPGWGAAAEVHVKAGQALYLPAGWFHEVTSYSGSAGTAHIALNYWFHPPDNLVPATGSQTPAAYVSSFWPAWWNDRVERHKWPRELILPVPQ